ncbi:hypothetical protein GIB67_010261, partial [Kingdonia uniflora]
RDCNSSSSKKIDNEEKDTMNLTEEIPLNGSNAVIGRALVHELQDDLGKGGHELSLSTGNDGG